MTEDDIESLPVTEPYKCTRCKGHSREEIQRQLKERYDRLKNDLSSIQSELSEVQLQSTSLTEHFESKTGPIERGILAEMKNKSIKWEEYYGRIYTGKTNLLNMIVWCFHIFYFKQTFEAIIIIFT